MAFDERIAVAVVQIHDRLVESGAHEQADQFASALEAYDQEDYESCLLLLLDIIQEMV